MTYEFKLDNFVSVPINGDQRLIIWDKDNNYIDSLTTDISHYFVKNNCLVIKITNKNDLILSFESRTVAQQALDKLDSYRKSLMIAKGDITRPNRPTFNTLNRNMWCRDITPNADPWTNPQLVSTTPIQQQPTSRVEVIIRGSSHIECGLPTLPIEANQYGCYFTSVAAAGDPYQARVNDGDVMLGDQLYWVGYTAGFDVESTDMMDFSYLI